MALSFYLCSPLGWMLLPCCLFAAVLILSNRQWVDSSTMIQSITFLCGCIGGLSLFLILLAMANSLRAVHAATQCGFFRSLLIGFGITLQAITSCVIGLALFSRCNRSISANDCQSVAMMPSSVQKLRPMNWETQPDTSAKDRATAARCPWR